jgi:hypothetical protein
MPEDFPMLQTVGATLYFFSGKVFESQQVICINQATEKRWGAEVVREAVFGRQRPMPRGLPYADKPTKRMPHHLARLTCSDRLWSVIPFGIVRP